ncbi:hypothetical protein [Shewanella woodyi]|uniref:NlpE C-terminal OB domain-containing protein n=1 Tax=Shewanella woodyi (strain ATCC 51908 / MS32) TaxID=392500 RepID=B1KM17_SHEWM|nr:hypothetical protein [Shewanella woodyi]ACA88897.1 conserved hypothetical protein [Shewanella woodyi ATCC 51908]
MKSLLAIAIIVLFFPLIGCQVSQHKQTSDKNKSSISEPIHKGVYVWGHEVSSYQPCGEHLTYWVTATPASDELNQLSLALSETRNAPYQPIYIEAAIHPIDRNSHPAFSDGFAADYDAIIEISNVYMKLTELPSSCKLK